MSRMCDLERSCRLNGRSFGEVLNSLSCFLDQISLECCGFQICASHNQFGPSIGNGGLGGCSEEVKGMFTISTIPLTLAKTGVTCGMAQFLSIVCSKCMKYLGFQEYVTTYFILSYSQRLNYGRNRIIKEQKSIKVH